MAKLDDLSRTTRIENDDLFHLRSPAGVDNAITGRNVRESLIDSVMTVSSDIAIELGEYTGGLVVLADGQTDFAIDVQGSLFTGKILNVYNKGSGTVRVGGNIAQLAWGGIGLSPNMAMQFLSDGEIMLPAINPYSNAFFALSARKYFWDLENQNQEIPFVQRFNDPPGTSYDDYVVRTNHALFAQSGNYERKYIIFPDFDYEEVPADEFLPTHFYFTKRCKMTMTTVSPDHIEIRSPPAVVVIAWTDSASTANDREPIAYTRTLVNEYNAFRVADVFGANAQFTAPISGFYRISGMLRSQNSAENYGIEQGVHAFVNGVETLWVGVFCSELINVSGGVADWGITGSFSAVLYLNFGDVLDLRPDVTFRPSYKDTPTWPANVLQITRLR